MAKRALFAVVFVAARMTTTEATSREEDSVVATEFIGGSKASAKVKNHAIREIESRRGRDVGRPMGRRGLDVSCNSDVSLDSCLNNACGLSSGTCTCAGLFDGHTKSLTGYVPTELGLCTGLYWVYVYKIPFVATRRRDLRSLLVFS